MLSWSSNNQLIVSSSLLYRWCPDTHIWCNDYFINWKLNLIVSAGLSSAEQPFPCSNQQVVRQNSSQPACLLCPRQSTQGACSPKAVWCESHHTLALPASSRFLRLPLGLMLTLRRLVASVQLAVPAEVCLRRSEIRIPYSSTSSFWWTTRPHCRRRHYLICWLLLCRVCSSHLQMRTHCVTSGAPWCLILQIKQK